MTDLLDHRRKRALFRSVRRGTKESDAVIGGFARGALARLSDDQLGRFEALLDCNDPDLMAWVCEARPAPQGHDNDVLGLMREYRRSLRAK